MYHFLCQAYRLAVESWGETVYETDLKTDGLYDKRKADLYALYAQPPAEDRVLRCRQIVFWIGLMRCAYKKTCRQKTRLRGCMLW